MQAALHRVAGAAALVALVAGCTSTVDGTPGRAATTTGFDCGRATTAQSVQCVARSLSTFWTRRAGRAVSMRVTVDPAPASVPRACRAATRLGTAFTCPIGLRVYLTAPFIARLQDAGAGADTWLRIAATMAHEMGHVMQFTVHDPRTGDRNPSDEQSRAVEQQADCLGALWAAAVGVARRAYVAAVEAVLRVVDTPTEGRTHGTPAQRLAATRHGLAATSPAACGLTIQ